MDRNLQQAAKAALVVLVLLASGCETLHSTSFVEMPVDQGTGGDGDAGSGSAGS